MNKILLCPFCNSEAELKEHCPTAMPGSIVSYALVECINCKAKGPQVADWDNEKYKEQSIEYWNNRVKNNE